jgi:hypothetical protein
MISFCDNIKSFTTEYITGLDDLKEVTQELSAMDSFQGKTATRVKDYMRDVSLVTIKGMRFLHEEFSNIVDAYVRGYLENIDPATDTIIDCDCLEELINDNHSSHQTFKEINDEINAIVDESSFDLPEPSGGAINELYECITNNLVSLRTAVGEYEYAHRNDMAEFSQLANALSNFMEAYAKFHTDVSNLPFSIPKDNSYNRLNDMVKDREERKSQLADELEHIVEEAPTTFIELKAQIIELGNVPMLWWQMGATKRREAYEVIRLAKSDVRAMLSAEHMRIMEGFIRDFEERGAVVMPVYEGGYQEWVMKLAMRESTNNYRAVNPNGNFLGRYQFGEKALITVGFMDRDGNWNDKAKEYGVESDEDFLNTPAIQDEALVRYRRYNWKNIESDNLDRFIGEEMNNLIITEAGLAAAAHLVGGGGLKTALENGDLKSVADKNGVTVYDYMKEMGRYNINE